jgi:hypothetical protein
MQRSSFISDSKKLFWGGRGSLPLLPGGEGLSAPAALLIRYGLQALAGRRHRRTTRRV